MTFCSNYGPILFCFRDKARYWLKIAIFFIPPAFDAPVRDCNLGSFFSISGSGIEEFVITGSRRDYKLAEIYQHTWKKRWLSFSQTKITFLFLMRRSSRCSVLHLIRHTHTQMIY